MSVNRENFEVTLEITSGTTKQFELTIINPDTGTAQDLTDTGVYNTGSVKIYKPDPSEALIASGIGVSFTDRANGIITFTVNDTISASANAGNWIGEVEFSNQTPVVIDQQKFGFNIIESR